MEKVLFAEDWWIDNPGGSLASGAKVTLRSDRQDSYPVSGLLFPTVFTDDYAADFPNAVSGLLIHKFTEEEKARFTAGYLGILAVDGLDVGQYVPFLITADSNSQDKLTVVSVFGWNDGSNINDRPGTAIGVWRSSNNDLMLGYLPEESEGNHVWEIGAGPWCSYIGTSPTYLNKFIWMDNGVAQELVANAEGTAPKQDIVNGCCVFSIQEGDQVVRKVWTGITFLEIYEDSISQHTGYLTYWGNDRTAESDEYIFIPDPNNQYKVLVYKLYDEANNTIIVDGQTYKIYLRHGKKYYFTPNSSTPNEIVDDNNYIFYDFWTGKLESLMPSSFPEFGSKEAEVIPHRGVLVTYPPDTNYIECSYNTQGVGETNQIKGWVPAGDKSLLYGNKVVASGSFQLQLDVPEESKTTPGVYVQGSQLYLENPDTHDPSDLIKVDYLGDGVFKVLEDLSYAYAGLVRTSNGVFSIWLDNGLNGQFTSKTTVEGSLALTMHASDLTDFTESGLVSGETVLSERLFGTDFTNSRLSSVYYGSMYFADAYTSWTWDNAHAVFTKTIGDKDVVAYPYMKAWEFRPPMPNIDTETFAVYPQQDMPSSLDGFPNFDWSGQSVGYLNYHSDRASIESILSGVRKICVASIPLAGRSKDTRAISDYDFFYMIDKNTGNKYAYWGSQVYQITQDSSDPNVYHLYNKNLPEEYKTYNFVLGLNCLIKIDSKVSENVYKIGDNYVIIAYYNAPSLGKYPIGYKQAVVVEKISDHLYKDVYSVTNFDDFGTYYTDSIDFYSSDSYSYESLEPVKVFKRLTPIPFKASSLVNEDNAPLFVYGFEQMVRGLMGNDSSVLLFYLYDEESTSLKSCSKSDLDGYHYSESNLATYPYLYVDSDKYLLRIRPNQLMDIYPGSGFNDYLLLPTPENTSSFINVYGYWWKSGSVDFVNTPKNLGLLPGQIMGCTKFKASSNYASQAVAFKSNLDYEDFVSEPDDFMFTNSSARSDSGDTFEDVLNYFKLRDSSILCNRGTDSLEAIGNSKGIVFEGFKSIRNSEIWYKPVFTNGLVIYFSVDDLNTSLDNNINKMAFFRSEQPTIFPVIEAFDSRVDFTTPAFDDTNGNIYIGLLNYDEGSKINAAGFDGKLIMATVNESNQTLFIDRVYLPVNEGLVTKYYKEYVHDSSKDNVGGEGNYWFVYHQGADDEEWINSNTGIVQAFDPSIR